MSTIEAVVFDSSGTIINDIRTVWKADSDAFEYCGYKQIESLAEFQNAIRLPISDFLSYYGILENDIEMVNRAYIKFHNQYEHLTDVFPDAKQILQELAEMQISIGICSNTQNVFLGNQLEKFELSDYIKVVTGQQDCDEEKPSPKPILTTLEKLGADPEKSLYVGDMREDMLAGRRAGVYTAAINRYGSFHSKLQLLTETEKYSAENFPDFMISDLNGVPLIVRKGF